MLEIPSSQEMMTMSRTMITLRKEGLRLRNTEPIESLNYLQAEKQQHRLVP